MQRSAWTVDYPGMRPTWDHLGLDLPPYTPCFPDCPSRTLARLADVEQAVKEQVPELGNPWVVAVLVVLGPAMWT